MEQAEPADMANDANGRGKRLPGPAGSDRGITSAYCNRCDRGAQDEKEKKIAIEEGGTAG